MLVATLCYHHIIQYAGIVHHNTHICKPLLTQMTISLTQELYHYVVLFCLHVIIL